METKKTKISRSEFLKKGAMFTVGASAIGFVGSMLVPEKAVASGVGNGSKATWPMTYPSAGIDASVARVRAHDAYWSGKGCSYATFEAIVAGLRDAVGGGFNDIPTELMIYGHGGGVGWGATCGTINGAAAAISLVCAKAISDPMVSELYGWYTQTQFPSTTANTIAMNNGYVHNDYNMNLGQSTPDSPLCHISVTNYCKATNLNVASNDRKERCARMCGDVVVKAIEMLNGHFASGSYTTAYVAPALNATCLTCHGSAGMENDVDAKMECASCHGSDVFPHTTGAKGVTEQGFSIDQNYPNPFMDRTTLQFQLAKPGNVSVDIYNLNGVKVRTLTNKEMYMAGQHSINWDGRNQVGEAVASGAYIFNIVTDEGRKSLSMIKL